MAETVLGIDLGTSNSCVAIINADGKPEVLTNEWGEANHASCVSFLKDGRVIVGNEAKRRIIIDPEHTIYSAKRLIGRFYYSEEVRKAQAVCPYQITEGPNAAVSIKVWEKDYSLPEISALVLKELKTLAENRLGHECKKAVVTVPAYFNDNQRQATKDAGKIAGLEVMRIINEPTAASLAYGYGQNVNKRIVVYDLGGGTFDVSILNIAGDVFEVIGTAGDTYLGGDDFDVRIMQRLAENFFRKTQLDVRQDKNALQKLRDAAERAKKTLSTQLQADIKIRALAKNAEGKPIDLEDKLSAIDFAGMVQDLIQRTFKVCDEALAAAALGVKDVDGVVLVGGPTRLPLIRESVSHYFGRDVQPEVDPDQVVALGAAIQGSQLATGSSDAMLLDVTPLTLRIGTVQGYTEPIIEKNTPLPIERTKAFTTSRDNQERVKIKVYQGESKMAAENELLGEFEVSGFRVAPRGIVQLDVNFEIDTDGIVNVSAVDRETGKKTTCTINLSSGLTDEDIEASRMRNENAELSRGPAGDDADAPLPAEW